jgi:LuxR family quorum-sensing system transcriptional regulator SolR
MNAWREAQFQALLNAKSEEAIFAVLSRAARELGFDYCAYGMRVPVPVTRPKVYMLNNYPADWQRRYAQENYLAIDPTVAHGMRSVMPLVWSEKIFATCRGFWEEARAHGLRVGWAQSCYNANGVGGLMTLARSHDDLSSTELEDRTAQMSWLAQAAHETFCPLVLVKLAPETTAGLSAREIEVLRWTAEGKTSGEIGMIMNIAERTVNFHVNNAVAKLGASNKTAATIKAAMLGLL